MVTFVGSNPSVKNQDPLVAFAGTRSGKILEAWIKKAGADPKDFRYVNVSDLVTEWNRPLRMCEVNLPQVKERLKDAGDDIVALGRTSARVLKKLKRAHLELPHPSPRNRKLNDPRVVEDTVAELRSFLQCAKS